MNTQLEKFETFYVWNDEVDSRLDPMYFHPARMEAIDKLKDSRTQLLPLNEVVEFRREIVTDIPQNLPYVGLENIASNTGEYIEGTDKESVSSAFVFEKSDVLFPKLRPYLNKVFFADFEGVCSTEFHVLRAKKVNPYFLFAFLNSSIVVQQTSRLMTGNTLPRVQTKDVNELLVPILDTKEQEKIINVMKAAFDDKRVKETKANKILDSIDDFVLNELDIKPEPEKEQMTFEVWSDETNGIFSPLFFIAKSDIKEGILLKEAAFVNPLREKLNIDDEEKVPYVGLPETGDHQVKNILMRPYKEVRGRNVIKEGDILFARIEPSVFNKKYIYVNDLGEHDFAFTSTEFYVVEPKSNIDPMFLFYMFFSTPVYKQVAGKTTGSTGRRRLDKTVFKNILIPCPAIETQQKIAEDVGSRYAEVRTLRSGANKIVVSAQKQVEQMILDN